MSQYTSCRNLVAQTILSSIIALGIFGCGSHRSIQNENVKIEMSDVADKGVATWESAIWGDINYNGAPWVRNSSKPFGITQGLQNRHLSVWASHGRYYDVKKNRWKWQRPYLFGTTEDLFTQTIVVPYLIPMLEKAGANVFTPRERDWQKNEIIIDNDSKSKSHLYSEQNTNNSWKDAKTKGFAIKSGVYADNENPFEAGTTRMARTVRNNGSEILYQPQFKESGSYAVYVSYPTLENSVDDARYTVYHKGQITEFVVNQRIGGGTWVYLGTFDFDKGCNKYNCVILSNISKSKGVVTADAVRFGGGMGNIERGGETSGLPRCMEGARYYAQWAGAPYSVYGAKNGQDDYSDDINVRSKMTNWLAGGSCYMPSIKGKNVPIELSLAVHSDAGYAADYAGIIGSLSICTTDFHDGTLNSGISRQASKKFATMLLNNIQKDIAYNYGNWNVREVYDRNYSETRVPEIPSAIIETMSHQSFPDMALGQDPNFRFTLARSIYKTILRYVNEGHDQSYTVSPLSPHAFSAEFTGSNEVTLRWEPETDRLEQSARPTGYIIYTAIGDNDFDNGIKVNSKSYKMRLIQGIPYRFRVSAINKGGESFPSETLSAICHQGAKQSVLVVNGFHRLSAPAIINTQTMQGFDFDNDPGVSYGKTGGWSGKQICYDKKKIGIEGEGGLGFSGRELEGMFIAGNDFNNVSTHVQAIMAAGKYNIASCSAEAVENGRVNIMKYHCVDLLLGLEKYNASTLKYYKTFKPEMQNILSGYAASGGALLVSGSYIGSDMKSASECAFLRDVLKLQFGGKTNTNNCYINGMNTTVSIFRELNETHYAATSPEILQPVGQAFCAQTYADGMSASVAYQGNDYRCFTMGFPFECITNESSRKAIMTGIMKFLLNME